MAKRVKRPHADGTFVPTEEHEDADVIAQQEAEDAARADMLAGLQRPTRDLVPSMPLQANATAAGLHGTQEINRDEI